MTRELFVSSTPHETKVGMVEDDLLAEIYLERVDLQGPRNPRAPGNAIGLR